ncbi:hypothetical protein BDR04DRAFT_1032451 [Suillus decipiens]|nr:hypothetical protein BDR04DRAFT_1032451 [Suillus decipiens]
MALSPNSEIVIVANGCNDGKVKLWNIETKKIIAKWEGHTVVVGALCWSGDGNEMRSGSWDGTARVWDVKSGKTVPTIINQSRALLGDILAQCNKYCNRCM